MNTMTDNDLYTFLCQKIVTLLTKDHVSLQVSKLLQPIDQNPPQEGGIFLQKLFETDYGWQQTKTVQKDQQRIQQLVQLVNTTVRISCVVPQAINELKQLQPSDILRSIKMRLAAPSSLRDMLQQGLNILRITEIQNPFYLDKSQYLQPMPYFDVIICRTVIVDDECIEPIASVEVNEIPL